MKGLTSIVTLQFSQTDDIVILFMKFLSYSHAINAMIRQEALFDD